MLTDHCFLLNVILSTTLLPVFIPIKLININFYINIHLYLPIFTLVFAEHHPLHPISSSWVQTHPSLL